MLSVPIKRDGVIHKSEKWSRHVMYSDYFCFTDFCHNACVTLRRE